MENKQVKSSVTTWEPNGKQKKFLKMVKENPNKTLAELSQLMGEEVKSGSINCLVTKGLVITQDIEVVEVVKRKKKVKAYRLATQNKEE